MIRSNVITFIILVLLAPVLLADSNSNECKLSVDQVEVAEFIRYNARIELPQYENTLVAIAFEESRLGKYKFNYSDPSAGLFHKNLKYLAVQLGIKPNSWNISRLAEMLIGPGGDAQSFKIAVCDIKRLDMYWRTKGYRGRKLWRKVVQSYNAGIGNPGAGKRYLLRIIKWMKCLR